MNYSVNAKRLSLFGFYMLNYANADTQAPAISHPTNRPGADYGRANFDVRNRLLIGGNLRAPFGISFSPMLIPTPVRPSTSPWERI